MIFLNPTLLFGLLAASIPILIHLLNLRKLKKIEFSTLSFLKELQKTKIRKVKVKQWILLLLRVLIIIFLVAAFARPTLESITIGGTSSTAKTSAVFVLDNSFSMSIVNENGSYLNQAKSFIKSVAQNFQEGDEISIILSSDNTNENQQKLLTSNINEFINDISISYVGGNLISSLKHASISLKESENFNKEIYFISDFQQHEFSSDKFELLTNELINEGVKLYSLNLADKKIINLAVTDFVVNNQIFEINKPIEFTATITNYTDQPISNTVASLFIGGTRKAQQNIAVPAGQGKEFYFTTTLNKTGLLEAFIEIDDDDIIEDNKRYLAIDVPKEISLLILSNNNSDKRFIELVLEGTNNSENIKITNKNIRQISSIDFNKFNVVLISGVEEGLNTIRLNEYLHSGGGLIVFPAANQNVESFADFCQNLRLPKPVRKIDSNSKNNSLRIEKIDFAHPIFLNLFEDKKERNFDSPDIFKSFEYTTRGKGKSILSLNNGSSFLSEFIIGNGKVFIFNTAAELSSSNFPLKSIFAPLVSKSISYLTSKTNGAKDYTAGKEIQVKLSFDNYPQLKVIKPNKQEEFVSTQSNNQASFYKYDNTDLAGIYRFYQNNVLIDYAVLNGNPIESKTDYIESEQFELLIKTKSFLGTYIPLSPTDDYNKKIYQSRFGTELWRYFLLTAFILALLEMFISRGSKKELAELS